jgi:2-polyprenyl-3-methyl-5-hydroxy-6-metoxy-1,4-benzoquinol methylase
VPLPRLKRWPSRARSLTGTLRRLDITLAGVHRRLDDIDRDLSIVRDRTEVRADLADEALRELTRRTNDVTGDLAALHGWIDRDLVAGLDADSGQHNLAKRSRDIAAALAGLRRRVTGLQVAGPQQDSPHESIIVPVSGDGVSPALFDYDLFEARLRGDSAAIEAESWRRYGELLSGVREGKIVDVGGGRGEFAGIMRANELDAVVVEPNPDLAAQARARGLTVYEQYASDFLRTVEDGSLAAIVSIQVAEHLPLAALLEMVALSIMKLRPGGLFIAETPNPASWIVMHTSYIYDPTHQWPLSPVLFAFLCEQFGYVDIDVQYFAEASSHHLPALEVPGGPDWANKLNNSLAQLNGMLFGPQDYAIVARAPGGTAA